MPFSITAPSRYIVVTRDGVVVSRNLAIEDAIEAAHNHALSHGDGSYHIAYPERVLKAYGILNPSQDTTPPTVPAGLTYGSVTTTSVILSWGASSDAVGVAGYQPWRNGSPLPVVTQTTCTVTGLSPGTTYSFAVSAFDVAGNMSALSTAVSVTTATGSNSAPVWSVGQQELTVGTGYTLNLASVCTDADLGQSVSFSYVSGTLPPGCTFNDSAKTISGIPTTASASLYQATIRATDSLGLSSDQVLSFNVLNADATAPTVPAGLTATPVSKTRIDLAWTASSEQSVALARSTGLAGYKVYRNGLLIANLGTVTSYSDTALAAGTTYTYGVASYDLQTPPNISAQATASATTQAANTAPAWVDGGGTAVTGTTAVTLTGNEAIGTVVYDMTTDARAHWYDADGDAVSVALNGSLISGLTFDAGTKKVTVTGALTPAATCTVTTTADDGYSANAAEEDWRIRSQAPDVVWAHDFRYAAEVAAFMGPNDGVQLVPVQYADGPTGYCLRYTNPANAPNTTANWGRILSPVYAGENGLPTDDRAAGGTITKRHWTAGSKQQHLWRYGWWGHSSYATAYPSWESVGNAAWDGTEFWLQFRVRISSGRWSAANKAWGKGSKLWFLDAAGWLANQQVVGYCDVPQYYTTTVPFRQYTNRGSAGFGAYQGVFTNPQGQTDGALIESSSYPTCTISGAGQSQGGCWEWPVDTWVTIMLHVKPGRHNDYSAEYALAGGNPNGTSAVNWVRNTAPYRETIIEAFAALPGATSWSTLYSHSTLAMVYGDYNSDTWGMGGNFGTTGKPLPGFNQFAPTSYANSPDLESNGDPNPYPKTAYTQDFTQIIFSKSAIPLPGASA